MTYSDEDCFCGDKIECHRCQTCEDCCSCGGEEIIFGEEE